MLLLTGWMGCLEPAVDTGTDPTPTTTGDTGDTSTTVDPIDLPLAGGLAISKVSAYQGVERILVEDGEVPGGDRTSLVTGRDTLLRVFLDPEPGFEAREVAVIVTAKSGQREETFQKTPRIDRTASTDASLDSTVNFTLPADLVRSNLILSVEVHETRASAPGDGKRKDTYWRETDLGIGETGDVTVAIIPVRYQFDGSDRLPDTSDAQIDRITELMQAMYPVETVEVRVDEAVDWDRRISPLSSFDWSRLLNALAAERSRANERPNTYYYGLFVPEPSENEYCRQGCILGLSLLAQTPNDPYFRTSIGLGYPTDTTAETLVHEVGHAHGRSHAPCGLGGQSSDPRYPYAGASIGTWGFDERTQELLDPGDVVDMMSYCAPIWVSDYTWEALYERIGDVENSPRGATVTRTMYATDPDTGSLSLLGDATLSANSVGERITVPVVDAFGRTRRAPASLYRFGDAEGGLVSFDEPLAPGSRATLGL